MTDSPSGRVLSVIACGAGPATAIGTLIGQASDRGWTVQVIATPAALDFLDVAAVGKQIGLPVRSRYRKPGEPRSEKADAIIVAPATYNTINKWAQGVSDTYALGVLAETTGLRSAAASRPCSPKASISSSAPAASNLTHRTPAESSSTPGHGTSPLMKQIAWHRALRPETASG